ncbi:DUF1289 domain-containing protein [Alphaproteobacteria bacterium]|nr:DUF1289 domain-containing protein [Alphaproteobacteria bacterium]
MNEKDNNVKSPCRQVCAVSARTQFCVGCGRKLMEIGGWSSLSDDEKRAVLAQLPDRLAAMKQA